MCANRVKCQIVILTDKFGSLGEAKRDNDGLEDKNSRTMDALHQSPIVNTRPPHLQLNITLLVLIPTKYVLKLL